MRRNLDGTRNKQDLNIQDIPYTYPQGAALTRWRIVNWWKMQPYLTPAHLPDDVRVALGIIGRYVDRQGPV